MHKAPMTILWMVLGAFAFGQNTVSDISGTVRGQDQLPLPQVAVTVTNTATGLERKVSTDAQIGRAHV